MVRVPRLGEVVEFLHRTSAKEADIFLPAMVVRVRSHREVDLQVFTNGGASGHMVEQGTVWAPLAAYAPREARMQNSWCWPAPAADVCSRVAQIASEVLDSERGAATTGQDGIVPPGVRAMRERALKAGCYDPATYQKWLEQQLEQAATRLASYEGEIL